MHDTPNLVRDLVEAALLDRLEELADYLRNSRELMNAEEAASFIRMPYSEFHNIAPQLPRHAISGRRYVYHRSELLE